jgi:HAD superfamily phosphatase (TIGR01668 family)
MIKCFFRASKFIPSEYVHSFFDIDFVNLKQKGFKYIITDLDNTLISYDESLPTRQITVAFTKLKEMGFEIILLSNNHPPRIDKFVQNLGIKGIASARKPLKKGFKKAMKLMDGATKTNTLVIGDQLVTDIFGAKRMGLYAVLVDPLKRKTEKWYTRMNRKLERALIQKIKRKHRDMFDSLNLGEREV